jgi:hypothetical protein
MKQLIVVTLFIIGASAAHAQDVWRKSNALYVEIAGSAGFGSVNFEQIFHKINHTAFTWRVGLSFTPIDKNNGIGLIFPILLNACIGKHAHKLELGLGQGITVTTKGSFFLLTTPVLGYRHQSESKNWFYRITYTPLVSYLFDFQIQQWGGVSIGYTFNKK